MQELKGRAAELQDKMSDLHADFCQSAARQADPPAAAEWQQQWDAQVRQVTEAQQMLKSEQVGLHTAETLASAEQAAGRLEQQLAGLKEAEGGGAGAKE